MNLTPLKTVSIAIILSLTSHIALAQPSLVQIGIAVQDITADGQTVIGTIYDRPIGEYAVVRYTRGGDVTVIPGAVIGGNGKMSCSDNAGVVALEMDNISDWGDLNCFNNNFNPPYNPPCPIPAITYHWTSNSGWMNCGSFDWTTETVNYSCDGAPSAPVNVRVGGTRCDYFVNSPNDISGDGRYIVGGGYYATATPRSNGCAPFGFCGEFRAFRCDTLLGTFESLPVQPGTTTARADRVNGDGSVVVGYDLGNSPDPDGVGGPLQAYSGRRLSVWRNGVQTILDAYGSQDNACVTRDGTKVVGEISRTSDQLIFGLEPNPQDQNKAEVVRWTFDGAAWVPESLGRPASWVVDELAIPPIRTMALSVSDDGETVVGVVWYNFTNFGPTSIIRPFIRKPSINGGVPMDLEAYILSQLPPGDMTFSGIDIYHATGLSADGSSMLVYYRDTRSPCETIIGNGIVYLDPVPCTPPTVTLDSPGVVTTSETALFGFEVLNARVTGSLPMTTRWQKKSLTTAEWVDVVDDPCPEGSQFNYRGSDTPRFLVGTYTCDGGAGDYRCVVTNACGSAISEPVHLSIIEESTRLFCGIVPGDMDGNGLVDIFDTPDFVASLLCQPFTGPVPADRADINLDGLKNGLDIQAFVDAVLQL